MTTEKVVGASSLPTIDRGTGSRTKMSRKRFLAFIMVGIMIVSAVSMVAPGILGNNGQDDNDQTAGVSWAPAGAREAIYKVDHLFENYMKAQNYTKAAHGNIQRIQERYLGHHSQSVMGNNEWLNTSLGASPRESLYSEMTLRNDYPYTFYWNPCPTGKLVPTLPSGLATWAPFRISGVVKNDTALHTGYGGLTLGAASTANVPFIPFMNRSLSGTSSWGTPYSAVKGGYVNVSLYGTYMTSEEMDALNAGTHYGNWFYGLPAGEALDGGSNDGYFFELHGSIQLSRYALTTFLNWTPGVRSRLHDGSRGALDSTDARVWFAAEKTALTKMWADWLWENYSQTPVFKAGNAPYWGHLVNNGNIYTVYEFDYAGGTDSHVALRLDPGNGTSMNSLTLRVYMEGWGPDAALIRMLEASGLTGSVGKVGVGLWQNRGTMVNYGEDVYVNCTIRESMANSSFREVVTYSMVGWEDPSKTVWNSGWMIELGAHADYIPNLAGQTTYPSPMNKYQYPGTGSTKLDLYTGDTTKSRDWRSPGALLFNTNASTILTTPQVRNISAYEAIIMDLNILSSPWLVAKGLTAKFGSQTMAVQPYQGTTATVGAPMTAKYTRYLYWGTVKLGQGSYPQTQMLGMYNAATKILNLSGGVTGLTFGNVFNQDYWGGNTGQTSRVYTRALPFLQLDVVAVDHYHVDVDARMDGSSGTAPYMWNTNYVVKVTPHNASTTLYSGGAIPRNMNGRLIVNETVTLSSNNPGVTWPTGLPAPAIGNGTSVTFNNATNPGGKAFTVVRFGGADDNSFVNVTNAQFGFSVGGLNGAPVMTQAMTGSVGLFVVLIPEFATVLIPIVGVMAMFFIFRTRKRKRED
jgi:hypothetical protein